MASERRDAMVELGRVILVGGTCLFTGWFVGSRGSVSDLKNAASKCDERVAAASPSSQPSPEITQDTLVEAIRAAERTAHAEAMREKAQRLALCEERGGVSVMGFGPRVVCLNRQAVYEIEGKR